METETKNGYAREDGVLSAQNKIFSFIAKNVYEIVIVLVCVAFMLKGVADIEKTGATLIEILGNGFITMLFSMSICRLLEGKGLWAGEQTQAYKDAIAEYNAEAKKAGPYIKEMDKWCGEWTIQNRIEAITIKLYPYGLSYDDFMAKRYDASKYTDKQQKQLEKIREMPTMVLTTDMLMSGDFDSEKEIDYKKVTKQNYSKKSTRNDFASKLVLSLTLGYYTLAPIAQWNWSGFAWVFLQTVLILGVSMQKYFNAYGFVNGDIRAKVIDKTIKLRQFNKEKGEGLCQEQA